MPREMELLAAIKRGDESEAGELLRAGADPNAMLDLRPMHFYAMTPSMLGLLEKHGADISARALNGTTRLFSCGVDIGMYLLDHGFDVNTRANDGATALHYAWHGDGDEARFLLEHGADPNIADSDGNTPLFTAAGFGKVAIVKLLVRWSANVNTRGVGGASPLVYACRMNVVDQAALSEVCECLIQHGASVDSSDDHGWQALHWASMHELHDVCKLLLRHGADPFAKTNAGFTAIDVASWKDPELARKLAVGFA
jgi:ankyrin repeat protein